MIGDTVVIVSVVAAVVVVIVDVGKESLEGSRNVEENEIFFQQK
jgi:hypothetical protein